MKWRYGLLAILCLAMTYPLSAGPYARFYAEGYVNLEVSGWLDPLYEPLVLPGEKFPTCFSFYDPYLEAWLGGETELALYKSEFYYRKFACVF